MMSDCDPPILVAALYRFTPLHDHGSLQQPLQNRLKDRNCRGTLLLASEGINGTIAGPPAQLRQFIDELRTWRIDQAPLEMPFADLEVKWSGCESMPFRRARVRLKKEIVTLGVEGIDPNRSVGTYVSPEQWNEVIGDPEVLVIDTRNDYEIEIGTFQGAINPGTESFREFPEFVREHLDAARHKKVAMFCTGGIRCEKSTAYLKQCGFEDVVHLRGGILKYLETVPPDQSMWQGECFVFDDRVSVAHGLAVGTHRLCHGCGWPITDAMMNDPKFEKGVACPRCADTITEDQRSRRRERQRQIDAGSIARPSETV